MHELVEAGKVRHLGLSNVSPAQLRDAVAAAPIAGVQDRYNLLERGAEAELLPRCVELDVAFVPYFPLASGLLTGKYRRGEAAPARTRLEGQEVDHEAFERLEALERFAQERGRTLLELAIGALLAQPAVVSVIAGATSPEQVRENAAAAAWAPTRDDLAALPG